MTAQHVVHVFVPVVVEEQVHVSVGLQDSSKLTEDVVEHLDDLVGIIVSTVRRGIPRVACLLWYSPLHRARPGHMEDL